MILVPRLMIKTCSLLAVALVLAGSFELRAQETEFDRATAELRQKLEESIAELDKLREQIAAEKIPINRELSDAEAELSQVRLEYEQTTRLLNSRTLDLSNLRTEIGSREEEAFRLSNLLIDYIRNFESRLHIAEVNRYEEVLESAKLAPETGDLSDQEVYERQAELLTVALDRIEEALGGTRFEGTAVDSDGLVRQGTFVKLGPATLFRSEDGQQVGTAEERLGSLVPTQVAFSDPEDTAAAGQIAATGEGFFPIDPTLVNAHKIEATEETLWEHVQKGGVVMVPIFVLAAAALLVALYKWLGLLFVRRPSQKRIQALLKSVVEDDRQAAAEQVKGIRGPTGKMLAVGVEHLGEPHELIEETMYETVLTTRLKLQKLLPFIAISAASAPLLGLLGTVTGIISTFKLITVFGTGDPQTLSGGISEALITTEFGLIVAIPSLLLHAFLSRKARAVTDQMEKAAVQFVNQASRAEHNRAGRAALARTIKPTFPPERVHPPVEPMKVGGLDASRSGPSPAVTTAAARDEKMNDHDERSERD